MFIAQLETTEMHIMHHSVSLQAKGLFVINKSACIKVILMVNLTYHDKFTQFIIYESSIS